jgi:hypothetical protein
MPNLGDTITNCIEVELTTGNIGLTMPLAPCFFYTLPEPYVFDQSPMADCSDYAMAMGTAGAGGASSSP